MKEIRKYSFIAKTSKEAMKNAIEVVGEDSIFLSSKMVVDKDDNPLYEVIVGKDENEEDEE
jgi:hypothetical protein